MNATPFPSKTLGALAISALLAACGGSQPPIGVQHLPVTSASVRAWINANAARGPLLYVAEPQYGQVTIFSFPKGQLVGQITGFYTVYNLCSDRRGNIWIMDLEQYRSYETVLYKYPHGGTTPIATLADSAGAGQACAVDPKTGDLAVANTYYDHRANTVVYQGASGSPTEHGMYEVDFPRSATYDNEGDLFVAGQVNVYDAGTDWMSKGSSGFKQFKPKPYTRAHTGAQWGDDQLTEMAHFNLIHRYAIQNGQVSYLGGMNLSEPVGNFVVHKNYMIAVDSAGYSIYVFNFPAGGSPVATIEDYDANGVALSVHPK